MRRASEGRGASRMFTPWGRSIFSISRRICGSSSTISTVRFSVFIRTSDSTGGCRLRATGRRFWDNAANALSVFHFHSGFPPRRPGADVFLLQLSRAGLPRAADPRARFLLSAADYPGVRLAHEFGPRNRRHQFDFSDRRGGHRPGRPEWRRALSADDAVAWPGSRSTLRSAGKSQAHAATTTIVPMPPYTTAGTVPNHCAVRPDSNWPTSFDAPMKIIFTALTRPRISSGVPSWMTVWGTITLTISRAPNAASAASDSARFRERPKTMVQMPKPSTQASMVAPARRLIGRYATRMAMRMAPAPGAALRMPSPVAPIDRISFA